MARDYKRLEVFHAADGLALDVFRLVTQLPDGERYGLSAQLRRAAISTPANLVEGAERTSQREFLRFVDIAAGSAAEARYLLSVARRLALADPTAAEALETRYDGVVRSLQDLRTALLREPG